MPDYYLFHQNMNLFLGDKAKQNEEYGEAMMMTSASLGEGQVVAAGFTRVQVEHGNKLRRELLNMGRDLSSLEPPDLFYTCKSGRFIGYEYTAISVSKKFVIEARGRVMQINQRKDAPLWTCISEKERDTDDPTNSVYPSSLVSTGEFEAGSRGLAYVCGQFGGQKMVVGFTNEMSGSDNHDSYLLMGKIMKLIWEKHPDYSECRTIFGGSFRSTPSTTAAPVYTVYASETKNGKTVPLKTTKYDGVYDFWFTNEEIANDHASVCKATWKEAWESEELSDHCGIALRLPMEEASEEVKK